MKVERITIFGSQGFIGSHITNTLSKIPFVELNTPERDDFSPPKGGFGTIIWAIGLTSDFRSRTYDTIDAHVSKINTVLSLEQHTSVVYLSSTRIYSNSKSTDPDQPILVDPLNTEDLYNLSKACGESVAITASRGNALVLRLSNVVGSAEFNRKTFLGDVVRGAKLGKLELRSHIQTQKDYIWIEDAVQMICDLTFGKNTGIFNVASGVQTSHEQWIRGFQRELKFELSLAKNSRDLSFPQIDILKTKTKCQNNPRNPLLKIKNIAGLN